MSGPGGPGQGEGLPVREADVGRHNETAAHAQRPAGAPSQGRETTAQTPPPGETEHPAQTTGDGESPPPQRTEPPTATGDEHNRPPEETPARTGTRSENLRVETGEIPTYTDSQVIDAYVRAVNLLGTKGKLSPEDRLTLRTTREFNRQTLDFGRPSEGESLGTEVIFQYVEADGRVTPYRDWEGPKVHGLISALEIQMNIASHAGNIAEFNNLQELIDTLRYNSEGYYDHRNPNFIRNAQRGILRDSRNFRDARIQHQERIISKGRKKADLKGTHDVATKELGLSCRELILPSARGERRAQGRTTTTEQSSPPTTGGGTTAPERTTTTTTTPARGEPPATPTYRGGVFGSNIFIERGFEEAEKQLTKMLGEGHWWDPRAVFRKRALRTGYEYFRQKLAIRAQKIMWDNQNPLGEYELAKARWVPPVLGWLTGGMYSSAEVINAQKDIEEFKRGEVAGAKMVIKLGETGDQLGGRFGKEVTREIKTQIEDQILLKIAHGEITNRDDVEKKIYRLVHDLDESSFQNYFGVDKSQADKVIDYFGSNLLELGLQMKADREAHNYSDGQLKEWTKLYFGKIKEGSDTKIRTKADATIRKLQSLHLGPVNIGGALAHPAFISGAIVLTGVFGTSGLRTTGTALAVATGVTGAGLLAGSAMAGYRASVEAREQVAMHSRESSYGLSAEQNAKVRADLQKIVDKLGRVKTENLINGGGQELVDTQQRLSIEQLMQLPDTADNRELLRKRFAEIKSRLDKADELGVDFIDYSGRIRSIEDSALVEAEDGIKRKLQGWGDREIGKYIRQSEDKLKDNFDLYKKQEESYIRGRAIRGATFGVATGLLVGGAANEGLNLDEATGGHVTGTIRDHLPGFLGGRLGVSEVPHSTATQAAEQTQHGGFGGRPEASLSHEPASQPASGLEGAPQSDTKPVTGPDGEWTKNSFSADRMWEHGNDQFLHTVKDGDKLILDITRIHDVHAGFAFTTPDGQTVFVPPELVKNNQLVLDPNDFSKIPGTNLTVSELYNMVVNKDAFSKIANGDFASELYNHRDVFNVKFIEASNLVQHGTQKVVDALATIQGTGHLPASINLPHAPGGPLPGGGIQPPAGGLPPAGPSGHEPPGGGPPLGPSDHLPKNIPPFDNTPSGPDHIPPSGRAPGHGPAIHFPFVSIPGEPFAPVPEEMRRNEATVVRQGEGGPEPTTPRPEQGEPVDPRLEQMFGQLQNPVIENNNRYFVRRAPDEITLTPADLTNLEQRVPFFERHGPPGPLGGWKASETAVPFVWDRVVGFGKNPRFKEAEDLTGGDSGLFALAANAAQTPREQARLYRALTQAIIKIHENNPTLLKEWYEAQDQFSLNLFKGFDIKEIDKNSSSTILLATEKNATREQQLAYIQSVWPGRIQGLKEVIVNKRLEPHHLRWIEFLSHSVKVQDLITKAQAQQRPEQAPQTTTTAATAPVRPVQPPTPPVTPSPTPTGGPEATAQRQPEAARPPTPPTGPATPPAPTGGTEAAVATGPGNLLEGVNKTLAESTSATAHYEATPQQLIDYVKTLSLPGGATMKNVEARISGGKLFINASLGTAVGDASFNAALINDSAGGIKVESQKVELPFLATAFRGQIEDYLNNLNKVLIDRINSTIDPAWETNNLSIAGEKLAVDFKKKGTSGGPTTTTTPPPATPPPAPTGGTTTEATITTGRPEAGGPAASEPTVAPHEETPAGAEEIGRLGDQIERLSKEIKEAEASGNGSLRDEKLIETAKILVNLSDGFSSGNKKMSGMTDENIQLLAEEAALIKGYLSSGDTTGLIGFIEDVRNFGDNEAISRRKAPAPPSPVAEAASEAPQPARAEPEARAEEIEIPVPAEIRMGTKLRSTDGNIFEVLAVDFETSKGKHNVFIRDSAGNSRELGSEEFNTTFLEPDSGFMVLPEEPIETPLGPFVLNDEAKTRLAELGYNDQYVRNIDYDFLARIIASGHREGSGPVPDWEEIKPTEINPAPKEAKAAGLTEAETAGPEDEYRDLPPFARDEVPPETFADTTATPSEDVSGEVQLLPGTKLKHKEGEEFIVGGPDLEGTRIELINSKGGHTLVNKADLLEELKRPDSEFTIVSEEPEARPTPAEPPADADAALKAFGPIEPAPPPVEIEEAAIVTEAPVTSAETILREVSEGYKRLRQEAREAAGRGETDVYKQKLIEAGQLIAQLSDKVHGVGVDSSRLSDSDLGWILEDSLKAKDYIGGNNLWEISTIFEARGLEPGKPDDLEQIIERAYPSPASAEAPDEVPVEEPAPQTEPKTPAEEIAEMSSYEIAQIGKERFGEDWDGSISNLRARLIDETIIKPTLYEREMWGDKAEEMVRLRNLTDRQVRKEAREKFGEIDTNEPIANLRFRLENEISPVSKPAEPEAAVATRMDEINLPSERKVTKKPEATIPVETAEEKARRIYLDTQRRKDKIAEEKSRKQKKKSGLLARFRKGKSPVEQPVPVEPPAVTHLPEESEEVLETVERPVEPVEAAHEEIPSEPTTLRSIEDIGPNKAYFERLDLETERVRKLNRKELVKEWQKLTGNTWQGNDLLPLRMSVARKAAGIKVIDDAVKGIRKTYHVDEKTAREMLRTGQLPNQPK